MTGPGGHADPAYLLDASGPAAPPRDNGELVFSAPWEGRAFGAALALTGAGRLSWEDFRRALIDEIGEWETAHPAGESWRYYDRWVAALERLVSASGLVSAEDLRRRALLLATVPSGHDHEIHNDAAYDGQAPGLRDHGGAGHP